MENFQGPSFLMGVATRSILGKQILPTVKDKNHKTDSLSLKRRVDFILFILHNKWIEIGLYQN